MKGFDGRVGGSESIQAAEGLELFPRVGAEEVRSSNLRLNAGGPGGSARFAGLPAVIVNHERVIWSMSEEGPRRWSERHGGAHLDCH